MTTSSQAKKTQLQNAIQHIEKDFHIHSKNILKYYLLPFSAQQNAVKKQDPNNFRDGWIRRETHGSMHASRVALYSDILTSLRKKIDPSGFERFLRAFQCDFNLTEKEIRPLLRVFCLFRDAARENEGSDFRDAQSTNIGANLAKSWLISILTPASGQEGENRLNKKESECIELFFSSAKFKDNKSQFSALLNKMNLSDSYDLLRQIIHDADCLDSIRCANHFKAHNLEIIKLQNFNIEMENQLLLEIHALIYQQKDMLFDSGITNSKGETVKTKHQGSHFSSYYKVRYEHAEYAYIAVAHDLLGKTYFKNLLSDVIKGYQDPRFKEIVGKFNTVDPLYNPFIHGTNSAVLTQLPYTDHKLLSTLQMLEKYNMAPMVGEIDQGGLDNLGSDCGLCFGRLDSYKPSSYHFNRISLKYCHNKLAYKVEGSQFCSPAALLKQRILHDIDIDDCAKHNFKSLHKQLVYLKRSQQLGLKSNKIPSVKKICEKIDLTKQVFYFLLLVGRYIKVNYSLFSGPNIQYAEETRLMNILYDDYASENIKQLIQMSSVDPKYIWEHPTTENLKKIVALLRPSESKFFNNGEAQKVCQRQEKQSFIFMLRGKEAVPKYQALYDTPKKNAAALINSTDQIRICVSSIVEKEKEGRLHAMQPYILKYIDLLDKKKALVQKCLSNTFVLDAQQRDGITKTFPLILCSENESGIKLYDFRTREFRTKIPRFQLGKDINVLATNTKEHKAMLRSWLEKQGFRENQVTVVLFKDLQVGKRPRTHYTNSIIPMMPQFNENRRRHLKKVIHMVDDCLAVTLLHRSM